MCQRSGGGAVCVSRPPAAGARRLRRFAPVRLSPSVFNASSFVSTIKFMKDLIKICATLLSTVPIVRLINYRFIIDAGRNNVVFLYLL